MTVLEGKSALVTGGSRGIGRAIVERLVRDGATVTFSYQSDRAAADEVLAAAGSRAAAIACDLGQPAQITELFDAAEKHGGGLDIVVNNAAVATVGLIVDTSDDDYDRAMAVNAKGTFIAMREAGRRLRDGGRIINLSTLNTISRDQGVAVYAASKAAVEQFTVVAAYELGGRGITVNAVAPGATDTDMLRGANDPADLATLPAATPLGRLGLPGDIADVVGFLAGPDSRWVTGQIIFVTGGLR